MREHYGHPVLRYWCVCGFCGKKGALYTIARRPIQRLRMRIFVIRCSNAFITTPAYGGASRSWHAGDGLARRAQQSAGQRHRSSEGKFCRIAPNLPALVQYTCRPLRMHLRRRHQLQSLESEPPDPTPCNDPLHSPPQPFPRRVPSTCMSRSKTRKSKPKCALRAASQPKCWT